MGNFDEAFFWVGKGAEGGKNRMNLKAGVWG